VDGENNYNDILIWSFAPKPTDTTVGVGSTFAFQFPPFYQGGSAGLAVRTLNHKIAWQSSSAPAIAKSGYGLYFSVTRNQFRSWVGERGDTVNRFHRGPSFQQTGLGRGDPASQAPFNTPVLNSDASMMFAGLATRYMAGFYGNLDVAWKIPLVGKKRRLAARDGIFRQEEGTRSLVKAEAVVSSDDDIVYFVESDGIMHAASAVYGTKIWEEVLGAPVVSEFSVAPNGYTLYIGDTDGNVTAWTVATPPPKCFLCENGTFPSLPEAKINLPGLNADSCLEVMTMGAEGKISEANCITVQLMARNPCGCVGVATFQTEKPVNVTGNVTVSPTTSIQTASPVPPPSATPTTAVPITEAPTNPTVAPASRAVKLVSTSICSFATLAFVVLCTF